MNCRSFQDRLYEYVEGSLSTGAQAAADRHLAGCSACRQAVSKEQRLAQTVSHGLRSGAKRLTLRPEIRSQILAAAEVESRPPVRESVAELWKRLFRLAVIPVSLVLIAGCLLVRYLPSAETRRTETAGAAQNGRSIVSIQISYRVPTYKFHQEGAQVVDSLSDETVVASGTFQLGQGPVAPNPERKTSL